MFGSDPGQTHTALPISTGVLLGVEAGPTLSLLEPFDESISIILTRFDGLTEPLLRRAAPDCIIAPLVAPGFDILDLAQRLSSLAYAGPLVAVTFPLPDRAVIEREVANVCRHIDLHVIELN